MGRFGSMIGESQLNDWGKPAQSWGRASSMIGESQLNLGAEPAQSWGRASSILGKLLLPKGKLQPPQRGISPSTLAESHLASRRAPPRLSERSASTHRESQLTQAALNPLSKLLACSDQPQKLRSARLTRWVCQVFASLRFPFCGYTRVWYLVIRSRIHLEPKLR